MRKLKDDQYMFDKRHHVVLKEDGTIVTFDEWLDEKCSKPLRETTYVERCVPIEYEAEVHAMIDKFLLDKGYKDGD